MSWLRFGRAIARTIRGKQKLMIPTGESAPDFTLPGLDGKPVSLTALLRDGPALLVFFKASCPVCQLTLPFLNRLLDSAVSVTAISQDDAITTQRFRAHFGVTVPALLDDEDSGYPVSNVYRITNVPSLFLVEPDGGISLAVNGFSKADLLTIAARAKVELFRPDEQVPEWRPG